MSRKNWRWAVSAVGIRSRTFKHKRHALDFMAEEFAARDGALQIVFTERSGWKQFLLQSDIDGAVILSGRYVDQDKAYLMNRLRHEYALRNVTVAA